MKKFANKDDSGKPAAAAKPHDTGKASGMFAKAKKPEVVKVEVPAPPPAEESAFSFGDPEPEPAQESAFSFGTPEPEEAPAPQQPAEQPKKEEKPQLEIPEEVKLLVEQRKQARLNKNWAESDRLRDEIAALGYVVRDTAKGMEIDKK